MAAASVVFLTVFRQAALAQALWSSGSARSEELPSLPLAWSHESHSCPRIP